MQTIFISSQDFASSGAVVSAVMLSVANIKFMPWERINVTNIFCEFHPYAWRKFGYSPDDMTKFLQNHNFHAFDMFQENQTICRAKHYVGPTFFK